MVFCAERRLLPGHETLSINSATGRCRMARPGPGQLPPWIALAPLPRSTFTRSKRAWDFGSACGGAASARCGPPRSCCVLVLRNIASPIRASFGRDRHDARSADGVAARSRRRLARGILAAILVFRLGAPIAAAALLAVQRSDRRDCSHGLGAGERRTEPWSRCCCGRGSRTSSPRGSPLASPCFAFRGKARTLAGLFGRARDGDITSKEELMRMPSWLPRWTRRLRDDGKWDLLTQGAAALQLASR